MNTKQTMLSVSATLAIFAGTTFTGQAAVGIDASATFTSVSDGSLFNYTVTVDNASISTASIGSFWFGWTPAGNFLPSTPTSPAGPTGWSANVIGGSKSSIQFVLQSGEGGSAIAPGSSGIFTFTSADSPTVLSGNDTSPSGPVGNSFVYSGGIEQGTQDGFVVTEAPEPSSLGLFALGGLGFVVLGWRKRFFRGA